MREVYWWSNRGVLGSHLHSVHSDWLMQPEPLIRGSITVRGYSVQFGEVDFDWSREPNLYGVYLLMGSSVFTWVCHQGKVH